MGLLAERYISTGKLVKDNPLPPGRYWIDIFEKDVSTWVGWSGGNAATVHIEKTEFFAGTTKVDTVLGWIYPWVPGSGQSIPDRAFVIFTVIIPTSWGIADSVGWPNTAPASIQTSSDTSTAQDVIDQERADTASQWAWVKWTAIAGVGALGLYSLAKLVRG